MTTPTTNSVGTPIASDAHSQSVGADGAIALTDHYLVEKLAQFNRERVPERVVHAKGGGAYGRFVTTHDVSQYTRAALFQPGVETEMLARFSTVAGEQGSPDTWRDPRGFSLKFYTTEGNYDLVGNNTPVFFIRDGIKFPDFIHSQKRLPGSNLRDNDMQWDFWTLSPESAHQVTWLMGDRGLPKTWRHMDGFGSHTYQWINAAGERFWVKYHFKTNQGNDFLTQAEADQLAGSDADHHIRDLYAAIEDGEFPSWTLSVQVMPYEDAVSYRFNPFDLTKVWPHGDYPLIEVGQMTLDRNPENYFAEIEQAAFSPAHFVPGIAASPDKMLQARIFAYADAHRYRLGTHYEALPVNAPKCPVHHYHKDGAMRFFRNDAGSPDLYYEPNSFDGPSQAPEYREPPLRISGEADRYNHRDGNDDYSQPRALFEMFDAAQKSRLFGNIAAAMQGVPEEIVQRQLWHFYQVHADYARGVANALGVPLDMAVSQPAVAD